MSKRAERRHHRDRLKRARADHYTCFGRWPNDPKRIGKYVNTATPCSCEMCGNPRRHFGQLTLAEKSWKDDYI